MNSRLTQLQAHSYSHDSNWRSSFGKRPGHSTQGSHGTHHGNCLILGSQGIPKTNNYSNCYAILTVIMLFSKYYVIWQISRHNFRIITSFLQLKRHDFTLLRHHSVISTW